MARLKTIKAFEEWKKDEEAVEGLLRLVASGTKLQSACVEIKRPYTLVYPFLHSTPELKARYEAALAARADALMHERLEIAQAQRKAKNKTPADVMATKLACDVMGSTAAAWNRDRYGERQESGIGQAFENLAEALQRISEKKHRALRLAQGDVVDAVVVEEEGII